MNFDLQLMILLVLDQTIIYTLGMVLLTPSYHEGQQYQHVSTHPKLNILLFDVYFFIKSSKDLTEPSSLCLFSPRDTVPLFVSTILLVCFQYAV